MKIQINKKIKYTAVFLFVILIQTYTCQAGMFSKDNAGTTGAKFLTIGVGSRAIGMGEAYCAVSDDGLSINWNPAGLSLIERCEVTAMHAKWLEEINYDYISYTKPLKSGGIGISATYLSMSQLDRLNDLGEKEGTFRPYDASLTLGYGISIGNLKYGIGIKYIEENLDGSTARGLGLDTGIIYRITRSGLRAGAVLENLGPRLKYIEESHGLPFRFKMGLSYTHNDILIVSMDVVTPVDNDPSVHIGGEYKYNGIRRVPLRVRMGYKTTTIKDIDALSGLSCGIGLEVKGLGVGVDYAWVPYGDLGETHRITLKKSFGACRETLEARVRKYYIEAARYYRIGNYRLAMIRLKRCLSLMPEHELSRRLMLRTRVRMYELSRREVNAKG